DLPVMLASALLLIEPPARAAEGCVPVEDAVVVQYLDAVYAVLIKELIGLGRRAPPVVVVALDDDLAPRQPGDEEEVLPRRLHRHAPGEVAAEDGDVLCAQVGEAFFQFFHIALPPPAENVHRLVPAERQVQ